MKKNLSLLSAIILLFSARLICGQNTPPIKAYSDNWVATDGLGRVLPTYIESDESKPDKYIGVFYWLWHPYVRLKDGKQKIVQELINENPESPAFECSDYYWCEPENGFYHPSDPWSTRRNLQMLANAGVDFIFIDFTNGDQGCKSLSNFMTVALEMHKQKIPVPKIVFFLNEGYNAAMNCLLDNFYNKPEYNPLIFMWEGKPLIMASGEKCKKQCERCREELVQNMFTWRYTWAFEPKQWNFLDSVPQDAFFRNGIAEQISVTKSMGSPLWNAELQGSSSTTSYTPPYDKYWLSDQTPQGNFFEEQWARAHEVNPQIICITGWNELTAAAWPSSANAPHPFMRKQWNDPSWRCVNQAICLSKDSLGNHIPHGWFFVDEFNMEFNRDIEPMTGGYTDAYYYQMVSHIRKFKGLSKQESASPAKTIIIDGAFSEWNDVAPDFIDPEGDCQHRNFMNVNNSEILVNTSGRNDITNSKVTFDEENIYFYVRTANGLTSCQDQNWMLLFIDSDKDQKTGWEGYDYVINYGKKDGEKTSVKSWSGKDWKKTGTGSFRMKGTEMEISIPKKSIGISALPDFYFHWADNPADLKDISAFFLNGESAPDRRFNYHYIAKSKIEK